MVRSRHQLVERLALVFHDWFATSNAAVGSTEFMLEQSNVFRQHGLGGFGDLVRAVTQDRAMLLFLYGVDNRPGLDQRELRPRADGAVHARGRPRRLHGDRRARARTRDVRLARGLDRDRVVELPLGLAPLDTGNKTVFGRTGAWTWEDGCRLVLEHPLHASFFVRKLWSYFIPVPPSADVSARARAPVRRTAASRSARCSKRS